MSDAERLAGYVQTWRGAVEEVLGLLATLEEPDWSRPSDLPGWRVHDIVAHLAHLESVLAGRPQQEVVVGAAPHIRNDLGQYTEAGVLARADRSAAELVEELASSVAQRHAQLEANPPQQAAAVSDGFGAVLGWSWETLLGNRIIDVWMHGQDVRRATGRPGGLDTPAADHTASMMAGTLPAVFAKRAQAPAGATLVLDATGDNGRIVEVAVGDDGRARLMERVAQPPTVRLTTDLEGWLVLAGGRRRPEEVGVEIGGDEPLGRRVLDGLAVTP